MNIQKGTSGRDGKVYPALSKEGAQLLGNL